MNVTTALEVDDLSVAYRLDRGESVVVREASLRVSPGSVAGLAGESGSGKSTLALAAIGYTAPTARVVSGTARLDGRDLYALSAADRRHVWGAEIGFVAQSANDAMNPAMRIGRQLGQVIALHRHLSGSALQDHQIGLLERVGIPEPRAALRRYPHEFSGGQLQRIAIAIAVACRPRVLILDEPTTGLDVQTQRQITSLLKDLVESEGMGALYVTHDLALLSDVSDRVYVMYAGQIVESGATLDVLRWPRHPYTRALLDAVPSVAKPRKLVGIPGRPPVHLDNSTCGFAPRCTFARDVCTAAAVPLDRLADRHEVRCVRHAELRLRAAEAPLLAAERPAAGETSALEVHDLSCRYRAAERDAVHRVSLTLEQGEALGVVGESGSGKSTLLRAIAGLLRPTGGQVLVDGSAVAATVERRSRDTKRDVQLIFQNPDSSLNPSHTIGNIIRRPLRLFRPRLSRAAEAAEIARLISLVGLPADFASRYPDELSGGQKQRIAIARAFAANPRVLLCDEITSALDVSVQASIIEILTELAASSGVAVVFVTHDLAVVRAVAARIIVMKDGSVCESGSSDDIFERPEAAYTRALLAAIPTVPDETNPDGTTGRPIRTGAR
ncbi:MAG TPA: ABC transporter ATP-binding protein [Acidothermaceae bacterium]|nr:ABC transporter ATP-binding protein [Acidothermaceae bacterium]